ncbi:MAG: N-6 DNA methylase, partial [Cyanobacteria bacterium REEB65]|nr:N-6 DNA methylase [Cyanobacteria bacterium REEB65]
MNSPATLQTKVGPDPGSVAIAKATAALEGLLAAFGDHAPVLSRYFKRLGLKAKQRRPLDACEERPWREGIQDFEAACDSLWQTTAEETRRSLGQVFSPAELIEPLLDDVGFDGSRPGRLLDPACGTGAFLAHAAKRQLAANAAIERPLTDLVGIEIDAGTAALASWRLALIVVEHLAMAGELARLENLPAPNILNADALAIARPQTGLTWLVGNPPFLEAKRAAAADKRRWRERFGDRLEGAFDL